MCTSTRRRAGDRLRHDRQPPGWVEAPYRPCPADFDAIAAALTRAPGTALAIVPGLICRDDDGAPMSCVARRHRFSARWPTRPARRGKSCFFPARTANGRSTGAADRGFFDFHDRGAVRCAGRAQHSRQAGPPSGAPTAEAFARGVRHSLRSNAALTHDLFSARTLVLTIDLRLRASAITFRACCSAPRSRGAALAGADARCSDTPVTWSGRRLWWTNYPAALAIAGIDADIGAEDAAARGLWRIARHARLRD